MKCKNWSNKLNNFVVRKLKSFKINGQQQVLSSTMPAMPKEKQTTPISLDENNFDEIKMKEQLNISNTSIGSSNSTQSSVSRLLRRCNSNNIQQQQQQQQQCCCHLDDCCPILATSTATGSIQDTTTTNSIINNSNIQQQNSSSKLNKQQQSQTNCNCHSINCNSSLSTTLNTITTTTTATATTNNSNKHNNLGKTNILDYKSSLREFMNSCGSTANNTNSTSPTTSTTISSTSSTSYIQSGTSSSSSLSSFSPSSATSTQTTITTTIKNICENNCHCSRKNSIEQNRMQYQYCNGDTTNNKNSNKKLLENNTSCCSNSYSNNSSNCNSNTIAQSLNAVTVAIPTTSAAAAATSSNAINSVPSTSSSSGITINGVNSQQQQQQSQQQQQQQPQQIPKKTPNDFIFKKYIGEGSFSTVYRAKEVRSKKEVAIKVCEKNLIIREKKQEYVRREREVMHRMSNCPGFVNLYCTFQDETRLYFVMTYAKNGDLLPHIIKVGSFDLEVTQHYAAELVLACENMHKRGIVHRDLKPENILLDENMHTLIADFGSAKILDNNRDMYLTSSSTSLLTAMGGTGTISTIEPSTSSISTPTMTTSSSSSTSSKSSPINNNSNCSSSSNNSSSNKQSSSSSSATATTNNYRSNKYNNHRLHNDSENEEAQTKTRHRRRSFVGTAQYVSPEILQDGEITPSCDLWALGCIIYQMISGLPPFRGNTEFLIFKQILNLNLEFPEGFDENAKDLVQNLLKLKPEERLGAQDKIGCYESIRTHPFFDGINWDSLRSQTPPTIYPYLPGTNKEDDLHSDYRVPDNLEPGFGDKRYTELIGWDLVRGETGDKTEPKNNFNLTETDMKNRLEAQKADKWNAFTDGELILKKGFVNKRKGLFARKRMLLLLTGPKLVYVDPVAMVKKGEIPWSPELRVEPKNFKIFFVHTPNRTYYLEDPDGYALKWVNAIENVRQQTYSNCSNSNLAAILQQ